MDKVKFAKYKSMGHNDRNATDLAAQGKPTNKSVKTMSDDKVPDMAARQGRKVDKGFPGKAKTKPGKK